MTGISDTVTEYVRREAAAAGYDVFSNFRTTPSVRWALSHLPGDGVAFFGVLEGEGLAALAKRVMSSVLPGAMEPREKGAATRGLASSGRRLVIGQGQGAGGYPSMLVSWSRDPDHRPLTELQRSSLAKLLEAIRADARKLCCRLENDGYAILEAAQPGFFLGGLGGPLRESWSRTSRGCSVTVVLEPDGDFNPYREVPKNPHGFVRGMAEGKNVVYQVKAAIVAANGRLIGQAQIGGVTDTGDLRKARTVGLMAYSDAKEAARASGHIN